MGTRIYGASDDLIEFDGDVRGEVGCYVENEEDGALIGCSDGTLLKMWYGNEGIWRIRVLHKGTLFVGFEQCSDEEADPHSDVVSLGEGVKCIYVGKECKKAE